MLKPTPTQPSRDSGDRATAETLLLVNGSADSVRLLSGLFAQEYRVLVARNGLQALEQAAGAARPDLILLEVQLPLMDGYEVCRLLKADPYTRDIPVIFSNTRNQPQDQMRCFALGAVDYVSNSTQPEVVRARVRTHLELKRQRDHLEALVATRTNELACALRAKGEFLSCVTHELRTPMNGVIGTSDLMLERSSDPEQRQLLQTIRTSARAQMRLIDDILDFARLDLGHDEQQIGEIAIHSLLTSVADLFQLQVQEKGLRLKMVTADEVPKRLWGDARLLRQPLANLIGNAIKFTPHGWVEVTTSCHPSRAGWVTLRCDIRDSGIGVPEEKQALIFAAFTQADGSSTRHFPGIGLGLSAAKRMVERLGGRIGLDPAAQRGAHFWLEVELRDSPLPSL